MKKQKSRKRPDHSMNTENPCPHPDCLAAGRIFHYECSICAVDCTAGTEFGPAVLGDDGKIRCAGCNWERELKLVPLKREAPELLKLCKESLWHLSRGQFGATYRRSDRLVNDLKAAIKRATNVKYSGLWFGRLLKKEATGR